jgi:hypothetical protein
MATSSPFVSADVVRKVILSPLAGFSSVCPETAIASASSLAVRPVFRRHPGRSMAKTP